MPTYDYRCKKCGKKYSMTQSMADHSANKGKCPKCGSRTRETVIQTVFAKTSKKS